MVKLLDLQAITAMHGDEYKAAVNRVIDSGWFLQGNENKQFEADYAKYIGTGHCIAVANGLDALYLLMRGYKEMGIMQDGDEIISTPITFISASNSHSLRRCISDTRRCSYSRLSMSFPLDRLQSKTMMFL